MTVTSCHRSGSDFMSSQWLLYLWGSPFWVRYLRMGPFYFNPAIEVVTFRLCGWCMLGVFLFPAFTHSHEWQDLLSLCHGMLMCTDYTSVYTLIRKSFGGMESEPTLTPMEKCPVPEKNVLRGESNPRRCIKQDREPNTLPRNYSGPTSDFNCVL